MTIFRKRSSGQWLTRINLVIHKYAQHWNSLAGQSKLSLKIWIHQHWLFYQAVRRLFFSWLASPLNPSSLISWIKGGIILSPPSHSISKSWTTYKLCRNHGTAAACLGPDCLYCISYSIKQIQCVQRKCLMKACAPLSWNTGLCCSTVN